MLFADDLDQHPLAPAAVEFTVEDLFPGAEIESTFCDGHHHFAPHDLAFHMGVGVILTHIVAVLGYRFVGAPVSPAISRNRGASLPRRR